jgi:hypothetical protein
MEVQAQEISIMLLGFPAAVHPSDDDKAHIQSLEGFVMRDATTGEGRVTPEVARLILQHGGEHDQALAQKGDPALNQVRSQMQPMLDFLSQIAAQMPPNVLQGPGGAGGQTPAPGGGGLPTTEDPIGDATKVMNALATLKKAGVPVTDDEVNKALAAAGLPPLQAGIPIPPESIPLTPEPVNIEPTGGGA